MITYSEAQNPYLSRPHNNARTPAEALIAGHQSATYFLDWIESRDPADLARYGRAERRWYEVTYRFTELAP